MAAVFTELFRVSRDELDSLLDPELEPDPEASIWLRGLGDLELVSLWESLPNAESDGTLMADLLSDPEAESLLLAVPENFLKCVRDLADDDLPNIVAAWGQMDELSHWSPEDLTQALNELRKLVVDAASNDQLVVQRAEM